MVGHRQGRYRISALVSPLNGEAPHRASAREDLRKNREIRARRTLRFAEKHPPGTVPTVRKRRRKFLGCRELGGKSLSPRHSWMFPVLTLQAFRKLIATGGSRFMDAERLECSDPARTGRNWPQYKGDLDADLRKSDSPPFPESGSFRAAFHRSRRLERYRPNW
jgi:hypothetical protein